MASERARKTSISSLRNDIVKLGSTLKMKSQQTLRKLSRADISNDVENVEIRVHSTEATGFQSTVGVVLSCLGSVVGTGNIWRFPRIVAINSTSRGSFAFFIIWFVMLFFWSIPIVLVEYSIGRFTRNSVAGAIQKFTSPKFFFLAAWVVSVTFLLSAYYPVIIGWCMNYLYVGIAGRLPNNQTEGINTFMAFAQDSYWPLLTQFLAVAITGVCIIGGIKYIERANLVLVPLLLCIVVFTFAWSLTREYAEVGINFLFTPSWSSLANPNLWITAASQNAFDTGAGMAVLATYAAFMTRKNGCVRYGTLIPLANNLVSFICAVAVFCTVFSTLIMTTPTLTRSGILKILQESGPGSTGLTFTWIPVLFSKVGVMGRVLCVLFFICLISAGISSSIADMQVCVIALKDMGISQKKASAIVLVANFLVGVPSALNLNFLNNQDNVWGNALIISGLILALIVPYYGPMKFRRLIVNEFGIGDWKLPIIWIPVITVIVPIKAVILLFWWFYDASKASPNWYYLTLDSATTVLLEWGLLLLILILINFVALYMKYPILKEIQTYGCDPYDPTTYEDFKKEADKCEELGQISINNTQL